MMTMTREKKPTGCSQPSSEPVACSRSLLLLLASSSPLNYYKRNFFKRQLFFPKPSPALLSPVTSSDLKIATKMFPLSSFLKNFLTRQKSEQRQNQQWGRIVIIIIILIIIEIVTLLAERRD
jgi:hypothetical protein